MSLIKFNKRVDFGTDYYVQLLNIKRLSLLQVSISWNDFPSWPYLQLRSGIGDVLSFVFWVYKFGLDITLLGRTWSWDYLKDIDEEDLIKDLDKWSEEITE